MRKLKTHVLACIVIIYFGAISSFSDYNIIKAIIVFAIWTLCTLLYFLPCFISEKKSFNPQIFLLNFFLGWTFIGWVIALIWAVKKE